MKALSTLLFNFHHDRYYDRKYGENRAALGFGSD
jgi:hypothetical protein